MGPVEEGVQHGEVHAVGEKLVGRVGEPLRGAGEGGGRGGAGGEDEEEEEELRRRWRRR